MTHTHIHIYTHTTVKKSEAPNTLHDFRQSRKDWHHEAIVAPTQHSYVKQ